MRATFRKWLPTQDRLRVMVGRSRIMQWLVERKGVWSMHRRSLAGGIAVGLFVGLTPTVGVQTLLVLLGALLFRVNFPVAFVTLWISNPVTTPALYWGFNRLGSWAFADHLPLASLKDLAPFTQAFVQQSTLLWLGSLLLAVPAAILGYLGFLWLWRYVTVRRWRRRAAKRARRPDDHHTPANP